MLKGLKTKESLNKTFGKEDADLKVRYKMIKAQDKFQKEFGYIFGMGHMFFVAGINLNKARTLKLRAAKYFSIIKSFIFSILINSL